MFARSKNHGLMKKFYFLDQMKHEKMQWAHDISQINVNYLNNAKREASRISGT
jgi:hypothetical protein